ncbi:class I adenylate-forming enzyme family protein [Nonomuraea sp. NPDC004297]
MISSLLDEAEAQYGDRNAVRDGTGGWTYRELARAARTIAQSLADHGVLPGDRVLCLLPGGRLFTGVLFGALLRGAVVVPLTEDISDYQLRTLTEDAEPVVLVTDGGRRGFGIPVIEARSLLSGPESWAEPPVSPHSPALIIYTSGSTGTSKGIVCPHAAVVWVARAISSAVGYRDTDVIYVRIPVSFDYGLYQILLAALVGAEVAFPVGPLSAAELSAIRTCRATVVPVVPTLAAVLSKLAERDRRPTSVRLLTNTGAALIDTNAEQLRKAFPGAELICMYGMSECKRITIARPDEDLEFPATVGRELPGTRLYVVDGSRREVPTGELGEIISAGPHVMAGYWRAPDAQADVFVTAPDGARMAVRTGDYGYLDDDGRLFFVGRRDDIFKRRGWRTSCAEIEQAILDVPGTQQAACIPPGPDGTLVVWVVTDHQPVHLLREIKARLGAAKVPDRCVVVERLPLTTHGKIDKSALRATLDWTR